MPFPTLLTWLYVTINNGFIGCFILWRLIAWMSSFLMLIFACILFSGIHSYLLLHTFPPWCHSLPFNFLNSTLSLSCLIATVRMSLIQISLAAYLKSWQSFPLQTYRVHVCSTFHGTDLKNIVSTFSLLASDHLWLSDTLSPVAPNQSHKIAAWPSLSMFLFALEVSVCILLSHYKFWFFAWCIPVKPDIP